MRAAFLGLLALLFSWNVFAQALPDEEEPIPEQEYENMNEREDDEDEDEDEEDESQIVLPLIRQATGENPTKCAEKPTTNAKPAPKVAQPSERALCHAKFSCPCRCPGKKFKFVQPHHMKANASCWRGGEFDFLSGAPAASEEAPSEEPEQTQPARPAPVAPAVQPAPESAAPLNGAASMLGNLQKGWGM
ncbi:hypothetical protein PAPYR_7263 [Paratrimastix pyriformis]|uniref:Uncharacterized protein n=1 Tax=Paratrimastix pyriformis TaxID=342808 RepID=A0ABQ8UHZ9_9EUKA|nr:hypothetical protein PAPYR_7263 [Paratrimastix pyriformis]|eukprot:GAFH01005256.1.p1 GENE.GAFH01005256.1~~GAFH01005256.1.p1  ORF type:complete len:190 (-),score=20.54 GAFH01005256.1:48-617(-)